MRKIFLWYDFTVSHLVLQNRLFFSFSLWFSQIHEKKQKSHYLSMSSVTYLFLQKVWFNISCYFLEDIWNFNVSCHFLEGSSLQLSRHSGCSDLFGADEKKKKRLQWFDQFEKKWKRVLDLVSLTLRVSVSLLRGRPKQTWNDVNRCDLKERKVIKDLA